MNYWEDVWAEEQAQDHVCPRCSHWDISSDETGTVWGCEECGFEWTEDVEADDGAPVCPNCGKHQDIHRVDADTLWCGDCDWSWNG